MSVLASVASSDLALGLGAYRHGVDVAAWAMDPDGAPELSYLRIESDHAAYEPGEQPTLLVKLVDRDYKAAPGVQKMSMQDVVKKAQAEMTDEVDTEHANRAAQKVAQEYFRVMQEDAPKK